MVMLTVTHVVVYGNMLDMLVTLRCFLLLSHTSISCQYLRQPRLLDGQKPLLVFCRTISSFLLIFGFHCTLPRGNRTKWQDQDLGDTGDSAVTCLDLPEAGTPATPSSNFILSAVLGLIPLSRRFDSDSNGCLSPNPAPPGLLIPARPCRMPSSVCTRRRRHVGRLPIRDAASTGGAEP